MVALRRADGLRSDGFVTGWPASIKDSRRWAPKSASASTSASTDGFGARTSTRRPCSMAVFAVAGPIAAMIVEGCGLPAIPTRLRTVEDDVNTTASNLPVLIASRTGAGGRCAHCSVRRDVVALPAEVDQSGNEGLGGNVRTRQEHPIDRIQCRVELRPLRQQAGGRLLARGHQISSQAPGQQRLGGLVTDCRDLQT